MQANGKVAKVWPANMHGPLSTPKKPMGRGFFGVYEDGVFMVGRSRPQTEKSA